MTYASICDDVDRIEETIILALSSDRKIRKKDLFRTTRTKSTSVQEFSSLDMYCPKAEKPRHFYGFDPSADRLFVSDMEHLVVDPVATIGTGLECGVVRENGEFVWLKIAPMQRPKGLVAITNRPVKWYAVHCRTTAPSGAQQYVRTPVALADGRPALLRPMGWSGFNAEKDRAESSSTLALMLSIYEDARRANSMLATVEESVKMSFPIGQDAYKAYLRMRDGYRNTPTGRRNPILHWCAEHLRARGDKTFKVRAHDKGAEEFVVGNIKLTLEWNDGYVPAAKP